VTEPLGASTMPQSVLPTPSQFERANAEIEHATAVAAAAEAVDSGSVDLDLDLDLDSPAEHVSAPSPLISTQPMPRHPEGTLSFDAMPELPPVPQAPTAAPAPSSDFAMDFDLSAISLDLEPPPAAGSKPAPVIVAPDHRRRPVQHRLRVRWRRWRRPARPQARAGGRVPPDRRHGRRARPAAGSRGQGQRRTEVQGPGDADELA
jgi:hypothetical protein